MDDPFPVPRSRNRASFAEIRREVEDDLREDMAEARREQRDVRERFFFHMAGRGPDGEGLGYAD